ncbi:MAG: DUF6078 family protein [Bacteroidaceae bacterium]|nr:DUF6078 family protein [Bacteroidaceae bacterium]
MEIIDFKEVPSKWALCFQSECPLATSCLRFSAGLQMPEQVTHHMAVMKGARKGDSCSMYREARLEVIARGMTSLFDGLQQQVAMDIRKEVIKLFGSRAQYYRYRAADYPLTPALQEQINQIFKKYGVDHPAQFDHTTMGFDFSDY